VLSPGGKREGRQCFAPISATSSNALGLTTSAGGTLADVRTGKNGRHALVGLLRQSVFRRLAGYEDVNDADRLCCDPAMR